MRENLPALHFVKSNVRQHSHKAMRLCAILRASLTPRRVRKAWAVVRLAFEDGLEAHNMASAYCALWIVFPKVISGLRKPIAIQAAISININLPE
jgi:hypothetical protein